MEKLYKDNPGKEDLLTLLDAIFDIGYENLQKLRGEVAPEDDHGIYFLGILTRATVFSDDLFNILYRTRSGCFTSAYILGRCIMDDYIRLEYVLRSGDPLEEIHNIDAEAMKKNLHKIEELVDVNNNVYGGKFPFYPTSAKMAEVREAIFNRKDADKYIVDRKASTPATMKFKGQKSLTQMAVDAGRKVDDDIARAYYFWRLWSDYVHFAPSSFTMEAENMKDMPTFYKNLQEMFYYLYRNLRQVLRFFIKEREYKPVDSKGLYRLIE